MTLHPDSEGIKERALHPTHKVLQHAEQHHQEQWGGVRCGAPQAPQAWCKERGLHT